MLNWTRLHPKCGIVTDVSTCIRCVSLPQPGPATRPPQAPIPQLSDSPITVFSNNGSGRFPIRAAGIIRVRILPSCQSKPLGIIGANFASLILRVITLSTFKVVAPLVAGQAGRSRAICRCRESDSPFFPWMIGTNYIRRFQQKEVECLSV